MENIGIIPVFERPTNKDLLFFDRYLLTGERAEVPVMEGGWPNGLRTLPVASPWNDVDRERREEAQAVVEMLAGAQLLVGTDDESMESLLQRTSVTIFPCVDLRSEWVRRDQAISSAFGAALTGRFAEYTSDTPYKTSSRELYEFERLVRFVSHTRARLIALHRTTPTAAYTPISYLADIPPTAGGKAAEVMRVVLKEFPVPSDDVSVQEVLEFRSQERVRHQMQLFRKWMRESIVDDTKSPAVIGEEIADGLADFTAFMKLQRMKYRTDVVQLLLTFPLATVERVVKLEFSQMLDPLFAIHKAHIGLLEAEAFTAPGRELAYLQSARLRFGG